MLTETLDINLIVTAGAVLLAVLTSFFALRSTLGGDGSAKGWKDKCAELDRQIGQFDSIFGAYPGLILVWEEKKVDVESDWGSPRVYGSPAALASMIRFAEAGKPKDMAERVLNGLADLNTISEAEETETLRANICLLYTSPSPRDQRGSRMPSSA